MNTPPINTSLDSALGALVAAIQKGAEDGADLKDLTTKLLQHEKVLAKVELPVLDIIIESLSVSIHSLGVLALL